MSRHAFGQIISNLEELNISRDTLVDRKGYNLQKWLDYGIVGWDMPGSTYFIILDIGSDNAPWFISNGIYSFDELCTIINYIFDIPEGTIQFNNTILINDGYKSQNHNKKNLKLYLSMANSYWNKLFAILKIIRRRIKLSIARNDWRLSSNHNHYNPTLEATVYKHGPAWNIARHGHHYAGYLNKKIAMKAAYLMWLEEQSNIIVDSESTTLKKAAS